jgi:hypothetical protein
MIQAACSGQERTSFNAAELPELLELLVTQIDRFPELPIPYRPQELEPDFADTSGNRLIVAISGAGKTAWAANGSVHSGHPVAYVDVSDITSSQLAQMLVRDQGVLVPRL